MVEVADEGCRQPQATVKELEAVVARGACEAQTANRFLPLVFNSRDGIISQRITAGNRGAETRFGSREQEAAQVGISRLTPLDLEGETSDFPRRLLAGEEVSSLETGQATKDGRPLDVWLTATKLVDEAGCVTGIVSTERGFAEHKRAEESPQPAWSASGPCSMKLPWEFVDSLTGRACEVNRLYAGIADRTPAQIAAIEPVASTHPHDVQKDLGYMALVNAGKMPGVQTGIRHLFPAGTVVWINRTISGATARKGIGLPLSRKFIELHGGKFSVVSEGLDRGLAVRFTLPVVPKEGGAK